LETIYRNHKHLKNTLVAPFGINNIISDKSRKPFNKSKINVLFLQYNIYKGFDIAVEAIKNLVDRGYSVHLLMVDNIYQYRDKVAKKVQKYIIEHDLNSNIEMLGLQPQEKLKEIYNKADIFLFPSYVESFGQGLLEAMINGIPCIVSDLPVFRELAQDSVNYFQTGDSISLAEQIIKITEDTEYRESKVKKAINRVSEFSWSRHVQLIENQINSILNGIQ
jgi:glycosyltransferase involved in cell wall biosynthesis